MDLKIFFTIFGAVFIAELGDKQYGAIASSLAAEIYGLDILETEAEETTRFYDGQCTQIAGA